MDSMEPSSRAMLDVIPVWRGIGPGLSRELVELWGRTRAIANAFTAASRSSQAVCIARDADGTICAVGTAMLRVLPRLQEPMYYYRQYFAPEFRGHGHAVAFYNRARAILGEYNAGLATPESLGVVVELENAQLSTRFAQAHHAAADSTFIGYSPRGLQLRVSYFEGATLRAKPLVRRRVPA